MISSLILLGISEMIQRWRDSLLMSGVIAVSLMGVLLLGAYQRALQERFTQAASNDLIAQESNAAGDLYASRLPQSMGEVLLNHGAGFVVPQIQVAVGTSPEDAVLLRGVPVDSYEKVERTQILTGRSLQPGDSPRAAMIGAALAEDRDLEIGGTIMLRGRPFTVVGIFTAGTYSDFEAWISLAEAQKLLGWGDQVSGFVFPAGEGIEAGSTLPGGLVVYNRGQTAAVQLAEWDAVFGLLSLVSLVMVIAAAAALANMLWRLAWVRRRQLAILRSLGYRRRELAIYLISQGLTVAILAYVLGLGASLLFATFAGVQGNGVTVEPDLSIIGALLALFLAIFIAFGSSAVPVWWITRIDLTSLLRAER